MTAESGGPACVERRTRRFFPEDNDTIEYTPGENLEAIEFLHRRLTVEDGARAHLAALEKAPAIGFGCDVISAPMPFQRALAAALRQDAAAVIACLYPDASALFAARGWTLPPRIGRVYDVSLAAQELGFVAKTDFTAILAALRSSRPLPFRHDPEFVSPVLSAQGG